MSRNNKRTKFTGRAKGHTFLRLPHYVTDSEEFAALSSKAVKLLVEIARKFRGRNNGDLSIPWDSLRRRGWNSRTTVVAARDELEEAGFIRITKHGGNHMCNLYCVTWEAIDDCPGKMLEVAPTTTAPNDWQRKEKNVQILDGSAGNDPVSGRFAA